MRAFVAIDVPEAVKDALGRAQETLRATGADLKPVGRDGMHLTLAFLGEVPDGVVERLGACLDEAVRAFPFFAVPVREVGFFGSPGSPRVVWAGLQAAGTTLAGLQAAVGSAVQACAGPDWSWQPEARAFVPHLTLARVRSARNAAALVAACDKLKDRAFGDMPVERVTLFRSDLRPDGPHHSVVHVAALAATKRVGPA